MSAFEYSGPTISNMFHDSADGHMYAVDALGVPYECGTYGTVEDGDSGNIAIYHAAGSTVTPLAVGASGSLLGCMGVGVDPAWVGGSALRNLILQIFFGQVGAPPRANNAAAIAGGLLAGQFYRTGADPDYICIVR